MSSSVLVAPREIVDVVYRASRVAGADSGVASLIGRAACFSVGQLGGQLDNVVEALEQGRHPPDGFSTVAGLEVLAGHTVGAELVLDSTMEVADLASAAFGACRRGCSITMVCGDGENHTPHAWLGAGRASLRVTTLSAVRQRADDGLLSRVNARHAEVLRHGIHLPRANWQRVNEHAARYLVSETLIDSAEATPSN